MSQLEKVERGWNVANSKAYTEAFDSSSEALAICICKGLLQPDFSGPFFVSRASVFEHELPKLPTGSASTDTVGIDRSWNLYADTSKIQKWL